MTEKKRIQNLGEALSVTMRAAGCEQYAFIAEGRVYSTKEIKVSDETGLVKLIYDIVRTVAEENHDPTIVDDVIFGMQLLNSADKEREAI